MVVSVGDCDLEVEVSKAACWTAAVFFFFLLAACALGASYAATQGALVAAGLLSGGFAFCLMMFQVCFLLAIKRD